MGPKEIIVLRHAEEPSEPGDPDLSSPGRERAERLATFLPATFGKPDIVVAAAANRTSVRSYLTMRPLCSAIGMRIWTQWKANQVRELTHALFSEEAFEGRKIFICWTHLEIPRLAKALKAQPGDYPNSWNEAMFDLILHFKYRRTRKPAVSQQIQPF